MAMDPLPPLRAKEARRFALSILAQARPCSYGAITERSPPLDASARPGVWFACDRTAKIPAIIADMRAFTSDERRRLLALFCASDAAITHTLDKMDQILTTQGGPAAQLHMMDPRRPTKCAASCATVSQWLNPAGDVAFSTNPFGTKAQTNRVQPIGSGTKYDWDTRQRLCVLALAGPDLVIPAMAEVGIAPQSQTSTVWDHCPAPAQAQDLLLAGTAGAHARLRRVGTYARLHTQAA